jgi:hypothetical protein
MESVSAWTVKHMPAEPVVVMQLLLKNAAWVLARTGWGTKADCHCT